MKPNDDDGKSKRHPVVLLIIDMLNTLDFDEGDKLAKAALPVAKSILKLKQRAKKAGLPVIYVNDNFGRWKSAGTEVFERCASEDSKGKELAHILKPEPDDLFVLKPRHSAFYSTNLEILLRDFDVKSLILTGVAGNNCVFFTANDAHMRGYKLYVPADCIASNTARDNAYALEQMKKNMSARVTRSTSLDLAKLRK